MKVKCIERYVYTKNFIIYTNQLKLMFQFNRLVCGLTDCTDLEFQLTTELRICLNVSFNELFDVIFDIS
ncbi:hypothetical protein DBV15_02647 [Temnothorax longispinosus]|uniref:Uncharacterized protein n=1 Tax=Temnothorax longispinosus TaxID=300112 RepID=A0A4S2K9T6_9HYME|nr:hypothetical protein DBV15_02647 [Temnothorax longispinosus]